MAFLFILSNLTLYINNAANSALTNPHLPFFHPGQLCSLDPSDAHACGVGFRPEVAMAMAKASALAYDSKKQIESKLVDWGFVSKRFFFFNAGGAQAFLSFHPKTSDALIAFRGTNEWKDVLTHLKVLRVPLWLGGKHQGEVHKGWHDTILAIWPKLLAQLNRMHCKRVWLTGHSLGGAQAFITNHLLGAEKIESTLYTFGAPKTGDARFASQFENEHCFRIENQDDPVPSLPYFPFGFHPSGDCRILLEDGNLASKTYQKQMGSIQKAWHYLSSWFKGAFDAHSINEYLRRLALNEGVVRECSLHYLSQEQSQPLLQSIEAISSNR